MALFHAVVWIDHHSAQVLQFDTEHVEAQKVKAHHHHARQHGGQQRAEAEFFADVCNALAGISEVLVTGSHQAMADFRHFIEKQRPAVAEQVVGYESVDHPSEKQLVAMARKYFLKYDRMNGTPAPM